VPYPAAKLPLQVAAEEKAVSYRTGEKEKRK
jgi:hypothetical protein